MTYLKILVTGGRKYNNQKFVYDTLDRLVLERRAEDVILIHGRATGADTLARMWAKEREFIDFGYPAKWARYGFRAGGIRNSQMRDEAQPDIVVAFPGGPGTANMVAAAHEKQIEVIEAITWNPKS